MDLIAEGVTGGIGGLIGRSVAFPFDTLKVKLATTEDPGIGLVRILEGVLAEEGILGFYRGMPFSAFEAMYQKALYVFTFATLKRTYKRLARQDPAAFATVLCGYLSELTCVPFSMPLEALVVQLQSAPAHASKLAIVRQSLFTVKGLATSLKSGRAYIVLGWKAGLEFAFFESFKRRYLLAKKLEGDLSPHIAFALGAVARALATMIMYPYARGKALCQSGQALTAHAAVLRVLRTEGFLSLYRGLAMELLRGVLQASVMFAVMERVRSNVRRRLLTKPVDAA